MFRHLTVDAVRAIHEEVLRAHGGGAAVRDFALLESAVAAPQASCGGEPLLKDPIEIAAAYLFYLCRNQPLVDGNKRAALAACLVFMESNGVLPATAPALDSDRWESLVLDVASSALD